MVKVSALVELAQRERLPPLQRKVLSVLEQRENEVFEYRDEQLAEKTGGKASSIGYSLWALHKKRLIDKQVVAGKVYFGSKKAIGDLRARLGLQGEDPFERATRNLERIRERVGNIDTLALLDEVREGR
jgi:hypothetical protein